MDFTANSEYDGIFDPVFAKADVEVYLVKAKTVYRYGLFKYMTPCMIVNTLFIDIIELLSEVDYKLGLVKHIISSVIIVFHDFPGLMIASLELMSLRLDQSESLHKSPIIGHIKWLIAELNERTCCYECPPCYVDRPYIAEWNLSGSVSNTEILHFAECNIEDCSGHGVYFHKSISSNV